MRAKRALVLAAAMVSSCSGRGEIIPSPSPAPDSPATTEGISTTVLAAAPTTTSTEPEPEPTTPEAPVTTRVIRTSTSLRVQTTTIPEITGEWAIPTYIVMCESGGSWTAYNASGASGPYQLMPLHFGGELAMHQSREAQHAKAAQLWNGGKGKHHWSECL